MTSTEDADAGDRPAKRQRTNPATSQSSNLDSFVRSSRPPPVPIFTTPALTDRDSTFAGIAFKARSGGDVRRVLEHVKRVLHAEEPASHEIAAWRFLDTKRGKDGSVSPDDFLVQSGSEDDGEKYGGSKVLKAMESNGVIDAVVVVSRWFGGTLLGPVRFTHITTVAADACKGFKLIDAVDDHISRLELLDGRIASLRARLSSLAPASASPSLTSPTSGGPEKMVSYAHLKEPPDLAKAERLVRAREQAVRGLEKTVHDREVKAKVLEAAEPRQQKGRGGKESEGGDTGGGFAVDEEPDTVGLGNP